jgi:hypothetical protein
MLDTIIGSGAPGIEGIERKANSLEESRGANTFYVSQTTQFKPK